MDSQTLREKRSDSVPHSELDGRDRLPRPFLPRGRVFKAGWMDRTPEANPDANVKPWDQSVYAID
jgi:hypothetical protein